MSPLRGDVLGVAFVLTLPLLALWWRGDFTVDDVTSRLPWCLLAGWGVVAVLHYATTPRRPAGKAQLHGHETHADEEAGHLAGEHTPAR